MAKIKFLEIVQINLNRNLEEELTQLKNIYSKDYIVSHFFTYVNVNHLLNCKKYVFKITPRKMSIDSMDSFEMSLMINNDTAACIESEESAEWKYLFFVKFLNHLLFDKFQFYSIVPERDLVWQLILSSKEIKKLDLFGSHGINHYEIFSSDIENFRERIQKESLYRQPVYNVLISINLTKINPPSNFLETYNLDVSFDGHQIGISKTDMNYDAELLNYFTPFIIKNYNNNNFHIDW